MPVQSSPTNDAKSVAHFQDLEMQDLSTAIVLLMLPCVVNVPRCPFKSLPGIKINCVGDRIRFHPDKDPNSDAAIYEAVDVPNAEPYPEKSQWPSTLAFMLGLPWLCRVVDNSKNLWAKDSSGRYSQPDKAVVSNPELGHLSAFLRDINLDSFDTEIPSTPGVSTLGMTPEPGPHFGSVILVHMFGERIPSEHVKMVNMFAEERGFGTYDYQDLNLRLAGFREYWDQKQRENNTPGVDLQGLPSPYSAIGRWYPKERCVENFAHYKRFFDEIEVIMALSSPSLEFEPLTGWLLPQAFGFNRF
ncbi:hypothetical protein KVR01_003614 [Diaporthe batatas]|uniref:uncharacterized protein n=1 Tax=Diaporthe batatas TaxID=748121 RepID=UPI001D044107|nr:uncharacterized protein KVR01_003614 [Diaporthe batatas]KAG8167925.1 hypothetical protein KVR01_003614 [Diaporthe batatas]